MSRKLQMGVSHVLGMWVGSVVAVVCFGADAGSVYDVVAWAGSAVVIANMLTHAATDITAIIYHKK